jgi:hypothetical protein
MLGRYMLTDMSEHGASKTSVYEFWSDLTERDCGRVKRSAASGSKKNYEVILSKRASRHEQQLSRPNLSGGVDPPRLQPFDVSVHAAIHQYKLSKLRCWKYLSDEDKTAARTLVISKKATPRAICAILRGLCCSRSASSS